MTNDKAIIIKGLSKEYYKKDSSRSGFFDKLKPNKSGKSFFALKDINLEINRGEVIGIIGPNGAGKSTLLKILAEVTPPTSGSVEIFGKVASILEIGIGFQPELSGYENIFLSGKLYGLSHKQISSKIDQIVEMFGFPDFLDTEVKHYSSGMYMRLAFAIIINIEADVYLFDEILGVGDFEFRKMVMAKIQSLYNKTIIIVTHAPNELINIIDHFLFLKNGKLESLQNYQVSLEKDLKNKFSNNQKTIHFHNELINPISQVINSTRSKYITPLNASLIIDDNAEYLIIKYSFLKEKGCGEVISSLIIKDVNATPIASIDFSKDVLEDNKYFTSTIKIDLKTFGPFTFYFDIITFVDSEAHILLPQLLLHTFSNNANWYCPLNLMYLNK